MYDARNAAPKSFVDECYFHSVRNCNNKGVFIVVLFQDGRAPAKGFIYQPPKSLGLPELESAHNGIALHRWNATDLVDSVTLLVKQNRVRLSAQRPLLATVVGLT